MKPIRSALLALSACALASAPTSAEEGQQGMTAASIPWQRAAPNGTKFSLLEGARDQPGMPFTYAFFIPAGTWDAPHWHSTSARVFVAQGTLRIGYGNTLDRQAAMAYPAGSFVLVPAGAVHFDGADEDTIIYGVATGAWSTTYLDNSRPASAGTPLSR